MNHLEFVLRTLGEDPGKPAPPDLADRALIRARSHPVRLTLLTWVARLLTDGRQSR